MRPNKFMDRIARCWLWLGERFHSRPLAVIGTLVGAVIWVGLMVWLFVETENTQNEIDRVAASLCGGKAASTDPNDLPPAVKANCQLLFNRIWDSATPEQISEAKKRLSEVP